MEKIQPSCIFDRVSRFLQKDLGVTLEQNGRAEKALMSASGLIAEAQNKGVDAACSARQGACDFKVAARKKVHDTAERVAKDTEPKINTNTK
jgi:hypothetical protein